MNWLPSFSALSYAWFFLLLIPLVLFYFLKLRRPRMDIPSLALWRSVLNDQRVNSPFQKFKQNILLLLQLMLLIALVLAAMQPFLQASPERAQYRPVLIDCSASMAALDEPGGESRLDVAKEQVGELIDNMLPGQQMSLIAFSSSSRRLTDFTDNKRVLRDALEKIEVSDVPSRPDDALRMTQALARTVPVDDVVMYTDGNLPAKVDFELPFELNYQKLPPAGPNIGITALNARRSGAERWDVFIRVESSKQEQTSGTVSLYQNGEFAGDDVVTAAPGESRRIVFTIESAERTGLEVRLNPDGFDSLESDNTAYLELEKARPLT
ncbi:MAG: vWA domain-containing protein, partial [Planctomycetaceae bacterium]